MWRKSIVETNFLLSYTIAEPDIITENTQYVEINGHKLRIVHIIHELGSKVPLIIFIHGLGGQVNNCKIYGKKYLKYSQVFNTRCHNGNVKSSTFHIPHIFLPLIY